MGFGLKTGGVAMTAQKYSPNQSFASKSGFTPRAGTGVTVGSDVEQQEEVAEV